MNPEEQPQPNPLRKQCGQVTRIELGTEKSLVVTTYKTFTIKDDETYDYDWDYRKNQTIKTLRESKYKKDSFVLLVKTFNKLNSTTSYEMRQLDGTAICGFGRDKDITERYVYVDKKW